MGAESPVLRWQKQQSARFKKHLAIDKFRSLMNREALLIQDDRDDNYEGVKCFH